MKENQINSSSIHLLEKLKEVLFADKVPLYAYNLLWIAYSNICNEEASLIWDFQVRVFSYAIL